MHLLFTSGVNLGQLKLDGGLFSIVCNDVNVLRRHPGCTTAPHALALPLLWAGMALRYCTTPPHASRDKSQSSPSTHLLGCAGQKPKLSRSLLHPFLSVAILLISPLIISPLSRSLARSAVCRATAREQWSSPVQTWGVKAPTSVRWLWSVSWLRWAPTSQPQRPVWEYWTVFIPGMCIRSSGKVFARGFRATGCCSVIACVCLREREGDRRKRDR